MNKDYIKTCNQKWLQKLWTPIVGDRTNKGVVSNICFNKNKEEFIYTSAPDLKWHRMDKVIWLPSLSQWLEMLGWRKFYRVLRDLDYKKRLKGKPQNPSIECVETACLKSGEAAFGKGWKC
jgi:hypothetical protein